MQETHEEPQAANVDATEGVWWQGRMVAFDLETTAADPEEARIVTAAIAVVGGGEGTETQTWLADPGVPIPAEAAEVHGITTERAQAEGRQLREVVAEVAGLLGEQAARGLPLVIFNARYDLTVLDRECRRLGLLTLEERLGPDGRALRVVDPYVIDKWLDRYRKGSRKLDAMCAHYGASLDGAHDASFDAVAAARVAWAIGAKGKVVRRAWNAEMERERDELVNEWEAARLDLATLHDAQVLWAEEQAIGLAEYFRSRGQHDDAEGVRVEWPVVPSGAVAA